MIDYDGTVSVAEAEDEEQFRDWISHQLSQVGSNESVTDDKHFLQFIWIAKSEMNSQLLK